MRRLHRVCVIIAALFALLALLACSAVAAWVASARSDRIRTIALPRRPDIVLVTIDALRADHLSLHGYTRLTTPAIDAFARGAVVFTQAIAQAPYTKASVASLMTSVYPTVHQAVTASVPFSDAMSGRLRTVPPATDVLPSRFTTLAETLRDAGYRTIGLTANPFLSEWFGFDQGFERFTFFPGPDFLSGGRLVDAALDAVSRDRSRPLFLWLHVMEPHSPYAPPPLTERMFPVTGSPRPIAERIAIPFWLVGGEPHDLREYERRYDEEIAAADVHVDALLRGLHTLRDASNLIVVLTADHGEEFLDHGGWEHSTTLYDELIRVPLLVKAPGVAPHLVDAQAQLVDIYPTLLELVGLRVPPDLAGETLVDRDFIDSGTSRERPAFSEIVGNRQALRSRGWKLIVFADGRRELYDLERDPAETRNVANAEPAKLNELERELDRVLASMAGRRRGAPEFAPVHPSVLQRLRALGYAAR